MNIENLVKMANQIGAFFESFPDHEQAVQDVANHLIRFWDPKMRRELVAYVDAEPDNHLSGIVRESIATNKPRLV